jgi:hypothetical protein
MKYVLLFLGLGAIFLGIGASVTAKTAIHEILGAQGVIGGLTLVGLGGVIEAIQVASKNIVQALKDGLDSD